MTLLQVCVGPVFLQDYIEGWMRNDPICFFIQ